MTLLVLAAITVLSAQAPHHSAPCNAAITTAASLTRNDA